MTRTQREEDVALYTKVGEGVLLFSTGLSRLGYFGVYGRVGIIAMELLVGREDYAKYIY